MQKRPHFISISVIVGPAQSPGIDKVHGTDSPDFKGILTSYLPTSNIPAADAFFEEVYNMMAPDNQNGTVSGNDNLVLGNTDEEDN